MLTCICMQNVIKYTVWFKSYEHFSLTDHGRIATYSDYSADLRVVKFYLFQREVTPYSVAVHCKVTHIYFYSDKLANDKTTKRYVRPAMTHPPGFCPSLFCSQEETMVSCYPLSAQQRTWPDGISVQACRGLRSVHMPFLSFVLLWHLWDRCTCLSVASSWDRCSNPLC